MKWLVDSSVLVAAFEATHPFHRSSLGFVERMSCDSTAACVHSLAETYASITRLPVYPKPSPEHALKFIDSIKANIRWVELDMAHYVETLALSVSRAIRGANIYDALIFAAAKKIGARCVVTWNTKDFLLAARESGINIHTPGEVS